MAATFFERLFSFFPWHTSTSIVFPEDIQRALEHYCAVPSRNKNSKQNGAVRIPDSNFVHITETLRQFEVLNGLAQWADRPRLFTILFNISRTDLMPAFIDHEIGDSHLPIAVH